MSALEELASQTLSRVANAEGASWKAMYLDGFSGDAVTRTAATARALLEEDDVVRLILERTEEEHLRKLMNQPTLDEEQFPDREEARRMRYRAEKDAEPLAERLWAMRNSAAQLAQSGARAQARTMLEEAYTMRIDDVAKRREASGLEPAPPGSVAPEALPELLALEECFRGEPSWDKELAGVRGQVLKAVRAAAARSLAMNDAKRAAALARGRGARVPARTGSSARPHDVRGEDEGRTRMRRGGRRESRRTTRRRRMRRSRSSRGRRCRGDRAAAS